MKTRNKIIVLREKSLANIQIARRVGISRQRVWKVLNPQKKGVDLVYLRVSALFLRSHGLDF
jgi:biotin operon repressor